MELKIPFEIDQVMYSPRYHVHPVQVACPVCCGHRAVWMRNLQGEEFEVKCEACSRGCEAPTGTVEVYSYEPYAQKVRIIGLSSIDATNKVYIETDTREVMAFEELYTTEEEALHVSHTIMVKICEQNIRSSESRTAYHRSHATWPVKYHNEQIRFHLDRIEWHTSKLNGRTKVPKSRMVK